MVGIYKSLQKHEGRNWLCGRAVPSGSGFNFSLLTRVSLPRSLWSGSGTGSDFSLWVGSKSGFLSRSGSSSKFCESYGIQTPVAPLSASMSPLSSSKAPLWDSTAPGWASSFWIIMLPRVSQLHLSPLKMPLASYILCKFATPLFVHAASN